MNRINNTINIVNQNASTNILKEGNSVFVRILDTTNNPNKYIASFAGNIFEVTSDKKFIPGNNFRATIKFKGNSLQLIPSQSSETLEVENPLQKFDFKSFAQNSTQINNFLQNLNLPQDKLSLTLIQFFQQNQIKLNIPLIKKSRTKAKNVLSKNNILKNFSTSEDFEKLAELDLSMELKGISQSQEELANLYQIFQEGKIYHFQNNEKKSKEEELSDESELPSFLSKIFDEESLKNSKAGNLTLFNHIKTKKSNLHWIVLPFNFKTKEILYFGNIRLLLNISEKKLEKSYIYCSNSRTNYYFMIYYSYQGEDLKTCIKYFTDSIKGESHIKDLCKVFDKECQIEFSEEAKFSRLFTEDLPIISAEVNI